MVVNVFIPTKKSYSYSRAYEKNEKVRHVQRKLQRKIEDNTYPFESLYTVITYYSQQMCSVSPNANVFNASCTNKRLLE